jgi:hypothetical protein
MTENHVFERIEKDINENDVVLYMKGTKQIPQCGFSATVVQVMERLGVKEFKDINVLADAEIRSGRERGQGASDATTAFAQVCRLRRPVVRRVFFGELPSLRIGGGDLFAGSLGQFFFPGTSARLLAWRVFAALPGDVEIVG